MMDFWSWLKLHRVCFKSFNKQIVIKYITLILFSRFIKFKHISIWLLFKIGIQVYKMNIWQSKKIYLLLLIKINSETTWSVSPVTIQIFLTLVNSNLRYMKILTPAILKIKYALIPNIRFLNLFNISFAQYLWIYVVKKNITFWEIKHLKAFKLLAILCFNKIKFVIMFWDFLMIFVMVNTIILQYKIINMHQLGILK